VTRSVYVASPEGLTGKSAVALGLLDAFIREVGSVGVFRPLIPSGFDYIADMLIRQPGIDQTYEETMGVSYDLARDDADEAMHQIVERFGRLTDRYGVVLVIGSDFTDVTTGTEMSFNAKIAANLGSPVVLVVHGREPTQRSTSSGPSTPTRSQ
jgi:phosphate acetyltransferase